MGCFQTENFLANRKGRNIKTRALPKNWEFPSKLEISSKLIIFLKIRILDENFATNNIFFVNGNFAVTFLMNENLFVDENFPIIFFNELIFSSNGYFSDKQKFPTNDQ